MSFTYLSQINFDMGCCPYEIVNAGY